MEVFNEVRFYFDSNNNITVIDFFEVNDFFNLEKLDLKKINLSNEDLKSLKEDLKSLFDKYNKNKEIKKEEKENTIDNNKLIKFCNVDKKEVLTIIENAKKNQKNENPKFTTYKEEESTKINEVPREFNNKPKRVTRKNRFIKKVVKVTAGTLALLVGISIGSRFASTSGERITSNEDTKPSISAVASTKNKENGKFIQRQTAQSEEEIYTFINPADLSEEDEDEVLDIENDIVMENEDKEVYDQYINVEAKDRDEIKYKNCKENYYDLITKYSKIYGIDPQIALGIACHERGTHSEKVDSGGGIGLYQVQIEGVWDNENVTAYNFETNSWETYTIHKDEVSKLENNIKAGLMIFQESLKRNDYDIAKSIQEYNYGCGWMGKVIETCYTKDNPETEANKYDWLNYRSIIKGGDPHYIENVLKYVDDGATFEFKKPDGTIVTAKYNNLLNENETKNRL